MSDWNPEQYLLFEKERNQPIHDLIARIELETPHRILDIGCGPGNSTSALKERWRDAEVTGIDFSETMIRRARQDHPDIQFITGDAGQDLSFLGTFDLVFANASLQWIPDHEKLIPKLAGMVNPSGAFAAQIPKYRQMPISLTIDRTAKQAKWEPLLQGFQDVHYFYPDTRYYDYLSAISRHVVMWSSTYYHIMENHQKIIDMIESTGLRPYLNSLPESCHAEFLQDVLEGIRSDYPLQTDQKVLFPFDRFFVIAYQD